MGSRLAIGFSISKLKQVLGNVSNYNVLVTILTDGEENASQEYSGKDIKQIIEELKLNNWTFTYIGADHDVEKFAYSLAITNTMQFNKNPDDIKKMFNKEKSARFNYSVNISRNIDTSKKFYE